MSMASLVALVLAWWPYPVVDTCSPALAVYGGGPGAEAAATRLAALGHVAVGATMEALAGATDRMAVMRLLEVLAGQRDARIHAAIRPYVFHEDPELAAFATRALFLTTGGRALPTLEYLLQQDRSAEQTLAVLDGLGQLGLATSFQHLIRFFVEPSADVLLRGLALDTAISVSPSEARKRLRRLPVDRSMPAWLAAKLEAAITQLEVSRR